MKKSEVAKLLVFSASIEGREVTELEVEAWANLVAEIDYGEAVSIARDHYLAESRRLWPADLVRAVRSRRLAESGDDWMEFNR